MPEALLHIGEEAFSGCSSLANISIPVSLTSIPDKLFYNCSSLKTVTLPKGLTYIGEEAFSGTSIGSLRIPSSVSTISYNAFGTMGNGNVPPTVSIPYALKKEDYYDWFASAMETGKVSVRPVETAADRELLSEEKAEQKRIAEEKAAEKKRLAEEKAAEKKRLAEQANTTSSSWNSGGHWASDKEPESVTYSSSSESIRFSTTQSVVLYLLGSTFVDGNMRITFRQDGIYVNGQPYTGAFQVKEFSSTKAVIRAYSPLLNVWVRLMVSCETNTLTDLNDDSVYRKK